MAGVKAKEDGSRSMEAFMKEILKTMQLMGMANIQMLTDISTKGNGKTIYQTEKGKHSIPMAVGTMESF